MITCPYCGNSSPTGTLFCESCAAPLSTAVDQTIPVKDDTEPIVDTEPALADLPANPQHLVLSLEEGQTLFATHRKSGKGSYLLGRATGENTVDIDLSPINAYKWGVSRYHARLYWLTDSWWLIDLASSNGTFVNGEQLPPNVSYPLRDGDRIRLGGLKLRLSLQSRDAQQQET